MCSHGYYQSANDPTVTHPLGHIKYGYTLLVSMNQKVLNKSRNKHNKTGLKWVMTQRVLKSYRSKMSVTFTGTSNV